MIAVGKFFVSSAFNVAGEVVNLAFTTVDRMQKAACQMLRTSESALKTTSRRARDFADNPSEYADEAIENIDDMADDVADVAKEAVEQVSAAIDEDDIDRRAYEDRSKAELYELAVEREIFGRSTMNKAELIAALREDRS